MFRKIYFALALITLLLCAACRNNTAEVSSEYKSEITFTENSENTVAVGSDKTDSSESALQSEQNFESLSSANDYQSRPNKTPTPDNSPPSVSDNSKVSDISSEPNNPKPENTENKDITAKASSLVLKLLNDERTKLGIHERAELTGLASLAKFRADQLTAQFSHSWTDENGNTVDGADYAATALKYGKLITEKETRYDFASGKVIETGKIIERYSYGGGENCGTGSVFAPNPNALAKSIVEAFKSSPGHWNSLMSEDNYYDGVGIVILNGKWYCSINSSAENYG